MGDLINKISSYNLFNYLFPGIVFVALSKEITTYSFVQQDILLGIFLYYFIGLVISRFGSLAVEPFLKKIRFKKVPFLEFAAYEDFVAASKKDPRIEVLSEVNNTYRTLLSMFVLLFLLKLYEWVAQLWAPLQRPNIVILLVILFVMFLLSYRKQTAYVNKRVKAQE